jgi:hypothetical protein
MDKKEGPGANDSNSFRMRIQYGWIMLFERWQSEEGGVRMKAVISHGGDRW